MKFEVHCDEANPDVPISTTTRVRHLMFGNIGKIGSELNARVDQLIGGLWANMSEGHCRLVMVNDNRWNWIEPRLQ